MTALSALVGGGAGGLGGAFLAQSLVSLAHRAGLHSRTLQGRWGPPFFDVALFVAALYGAIAAGLSRNWKMSSLATALPFAAIVLPMFILERMARMGWGAEVEYVGGIWRFLQSPWYAAVITVYVLAVWGTIALLGRSLTGSWRGALGTAGGAFAAYLVLAALQKADPHMDAWSWRPSEFVPQLSAILDGILTGAGLGLGAWIVARRSHEKVSGA